MPRAAIIVFAMAAFAGAASAAPIPDKGSAIATAKRYMKAQCTERTPCKYRAEHEGTQWRVWVRLSERNARGKVVYPSPGKQVVLYFDRDGNLIRRMEVD